MHRYVLSLLPLARDWFSHKAEKSHGPFVFIRRDSNHSALCLFNSKILLFKLLPPESRTRCWYERWWKREVEDNLPCHDCRKKHCLYFLKHKSSNSWTWVASGEHLVKSSDPCVLWLLLTSRVYPQVTLWYCVSPADFGEFDLFNEQLNI